FYQSFTGVGGEKDGGYVVLYFQRHWAWCTVYGCCRLTRLVYTPLSYAIPSYCVFCVLRCRNTSQMYTPFAHVVCC
ncbi:hypothetical protein COCVIDRAFT_94676, partial [Bipolaris victoriae FI3]